ncbi:hypothetical protein HD806DRAFT_325086 [Xylariaceae sp. AK1471]|nr:hypothetical protein HD806DRAFT_325086 [Xylariaceae sp. AK1471]
MFIVRLPLIVGGHFLQSLSLLSSWILISIPQRGSQAWARSAEEVNLGQLCREKTSPAYNDDPIKAISVKPSRPDSYKHVIHDISVPSLLVNLRELGIDIEPKLQLFISIIYRPDTEKAKPSHYPVRPGAPARRLCLV